jgi:Tfp pilus assembly protein PilV
MIETSLTTTNILLGIMAAVSVLQALVLIGAGVLALRLYRQTLKTIADIEERQIAPLTSAVAGLVRSVDGILADVKDVTTRVARQTERVDEAVHHTMHTAEDTARRAFGAATPRVVRIAKLAFGVTCALQDLFKGRRRGARPTK